MEIDEAIKIVKDARNFLLVDQNIPYDNKTLSNALSKVLHEILEFKSCREPVIHRINFSDMTCYDCGKDLKK